MSTSLLIPENPLIILPSLVRLVGLEAAVIVQQLHFCLAMPRSGVEVNGHRWIYNTYQQWQEDHFPFWSQRTIQRAFQKLQEMHLVESCQPDGRESRRKYYRLNKGMVLKLTLESAQRVNPEVSADAANLAPSGDDHAKQAPSEPANLAPSCARASISTETTTETTTPISPQGGGELFPVEEFASAKVAQSQKAEEIYQAYPRKVAKAAALKSITRALKKVPFEKLLTTVKTYAASRQGQDPQFTKHPSTWFNGECWNDEITTAITPGSRYQESLDRQAAYHAQDIPPDPYAGMTQEQRAEAKLQAIRRSNEVRRQQQW